MQFIAALTLALSLRFDEEADRALKPANNGDFVGEKSAFNDSVVTDALPLT